MACFFHPHHQLLSLSEMSFISTELRALPSNLYGYGKTDNKPMTFNVFQPGLLTVILVEKPQKRKAHKSTSKLCPLKLC